MAWYEDNMHAIMWEVPCVLSCNMHQNLQLGAVYRKEISAALRSSELGLSKPGHLV
jgi:hypothetical protein